jgi:alkaline phosphatase D
MITNIYLMPDILVNEDQWMGYPASRERLLTFLRTSAAENVVILTGDIHTSWAAELVINPNDPAEYDPMTGEGAVGVEFVTPGITSPGLDGFEMAAETARPLNPHIRYYDLTLQGYVILDVTHERTQAAWFLYDDITQPDTATQTATAAWSVQSGQTRLMEDAEAAAPREAPAAAP